MRRGTTRGKNKLYACKAVMGGFVGISGCNNRANINLGGYIHTVMVHHIAQVTFFGYRLVRNGFGRVRSCWQRFDNAMLMGINHTLTRYKTDQQQACTNNMIFARYQIVSWSFSKFQQS